jgi:hypothetical protein
MRTNPSLVAPFRIRAPHASQQSPAERILLWGTTLGVGTEVPPEPAVPRSVDTPRSSWVGTAAPRHPRLLLDSRSLRAHAYLDREGPAFRRALDGQPHHLWVTVLEQGTLRYPKLRRGNLKPVTPITK